MRRALLQIGRHCTKWRKEIGTAILQRKQKYLHIYLQKSLNVVNLAISKDDDFGKADDLLCCIVTEVSGESRSNFVKSPMETFGPNEKSEEFCNTDPHWSGRSDFHNVIWDGIQGEHQSILGMKGLSGHHSYVCDETFTAEISDDWSMASSEPLNFHDSDPSKYEFSCQQGATADEPCSSLQSVPAPESTVETERPGTGKMAQSGEGSYGISFSMNNCLKF